MSNYVLFHSPLLCLMNLKHIIVCIDQEEKLVLLGSWKALEIFCIKRWNLTLILYQENLNLYLNYAVVYETIWWILCNVSKYRCYIHTYVYLMQNFLMETLFNFTSKDVFTIVYLGWKCIGLLE